MSVHIVTDSAADLTDALAIANNISVVPLSIRFGNDEFTDRRDLTVDQFWAKVAASKELPETAAPSPGAFEAAFRAAAENGASEVVCICLSSKISGTFGSATLAAKNVIDVIKVMVIDSLSLTMGQGTMAIRAAEAAKDGASGEEVAKVVAELIGTTRVIATLDTLENLKKGGRIGGAQAFIGSLLSIKPIIDVSTGAVQEAGKQRTRARSFAHLANLVAQEKAKYGVLNDVCVLHGNATDAQTLVDLLGASFPVEQIQVGQIGAVIGAHGGPGVTGITFNVLKK